MTTSAKDMRSWIADLDATGELVRIDKPVDPLTQMGSLLYQSREKALLFENLAHGWRSLGQAQRFGSKMLIDATAPPPGDVAARANFERIQPFHPELRLADFAAEGSQEIVRNLSSVFVGSKML